MDISQKMSAATPTVMSEVMKKTKQEQMKAKGAAMATKAATTQGQQPP